MPEPLSNQTPNFSRFADWCLHKDSLSEEARHTVEVLLREAGTSDCYEAEQILARTTTLTLRYQNICDLSPLSTLTNLNHLDLSDNQIGDLSPLSGLTNLTLLFICNNKTSLDLNPLSTLVHLTLLNLCYTHVSDLSPLSNLTKLTHIHLKFNRDLDNLTSNLISDLSPLSGLTNLICLDIGDNWISSLSPLSELINLKELYLGKNQVSDLSPLSGLTNLIHIYLDDNLISDLSPLSRLPKLAILMIGKNQISDLSPLSSLTQLRELRFGDSQISDLTPLAGLTNLIQLGFNDSNISDLSPLIGLINLDEFHLGNNQISDLSPMLELVNLTRFTTHATKLMIDLKWLSAVWQEKYVYFILPIDEQKAAAAVKFIYIFLGFEEPEIIYCPNPYIGFTQLSQLQSLEEPLLGEPLSYEFWQLIGKRLSEGFLYFLFEQIGYGLPQLQQANIDWYSSLDSDILQGENYISPNELLESIILAQLLVSKLNYVLDQEEQEALNCLNQIFENCGWLFPFEEICLVCDRPRKISLDSENRLHADAEPAIQFADGWHTGYYYHGVRIPEKYGKLHPQQWQAQWLLEEDNVELRRILIQVIGYERICEELQAQILDSWQEYTLLCIDANVDVEPIHLLKMTCPSTGRIHALRVPPEITSAREAIRWVNWDTDPEDFSVQT